MSGARGSQGYEGQKMMTAHEPDRFKVIRDAANAKLKP